MLGFPETGKTTYISALWQYLKDSNNSNFKLDVMPDNREYLETNSEIWLTCEPVPRTISGNSEKITLSIEVNQNKKIDLTIPDVAGESYKQIFLQRKIEEELYTELSSASGLLIFINAETEEILSHNRHGIMSNDSTNERNKLPSFEIEKTPIVLQLIDVIQIIKNINSKDIKLSIIISAWDLIEEEITPENWIKSNIPLMYNFIRNNFKEYCFFGVSAQGGDYKIQLEELLSNESPINRIKVMHESTISNDITLPLQYLIQQTSV